MNRLSNNEVLEISKEIEQYLKAFYAIKKDQQVSIDFDFDEQKIRGIETGNTISEWNKLNREQKQTLKEMALESIEIEIRTIESQIDKLKERLVFKRAGYFIVKDILKG